MSTLHTLKRSLSLTAVLALALTGCAHQSSGSEAPQAEPAAEETSQPEAEPAAEAASQPEAESQGDASTWEQPAPDTESDLPVQKTSGADETTPYCCVDGMAKRCTIGRGLRPNEPCQCPSPVGSKQGRACNF